MKTSTTRQLWMIVLGWMILPSLCLVIGYFLGRLLGSLAVPDLTYLGSDQVKKEIAESASAENMFYGGLLGMFSGPGIGLFGAGILTAQAIKPFFPLYNKHIAISAAGWLSSFIIGSIVTIVLLIVIAKPIATKGNYGIESELKLIFYCIPIGAIGGGFTMGIVGSKLTTRILRNLEPGLEKKTLNHINLRWGTGFALGGLLVGIGGLCIFYSISDYFNDEIIWIALAVGFAISGLCGSLIGGKYMLKRLREYASVRDMARSG